MYKIPQTFDITKLQGRSVSGITFGLNIIHLSLDETFGSIEITGNFSIDNGHHTCIYEEIYPITDDMGLLKLLEKSITLITINESRDTLVITFEDNSILTLIGNEYYESYSIKIGRVEILI